MVAYSLGPPSCTSQLLEDDHQIKETEIILILPLSSSRNARDGQCLLSTCVWQHIRGFSVPHLAVVSRVPWQRGFQTPCGWEVVAGSLLWDSRVGTDPQCWLVVGEGNINPLVPCLATHSGAGLYCQQHLVTEITVISCVQTENTSTLWQCRHSPKQLTMQAASKRLSANRLLKHYRYCIQTCL